MNKKVEKNKMRIGFDNEKYLKPDRKIWQQALS